MLFQQWGKYTAGETPEEALITSTTLKGGRSMGCWILQVTNSTRTVFFVSQKFKWVKC